MSKNKLTTDQFLEGCKTRGYTFNKIKKEIYIEPRQKPDGYLDKARWFGYKLKLKKA
ncbi:hypothetical protein [Mesohalobacter salilacus]|uniref:hypothetical protein n=1 Tax=Mesohalobacter salilacus TaxID=2491711 RepID=UPI00267D97E8